MKICIITCSNTDNHGARLQTYALAKSLQENGNDVRVIDYRPDYMNPSFHILYWPGFSLKEWAKLFFRFGQRIRARKRHDSFMAFSRQFIPFSQRVYHNIEELREAPPVADLYLAGSDQIWNTYFPNGTDPAFYLDFGPQHIRRESYAASFATTTLRPGSEDFVRENLKRFNRISVREESGVRILSELGYFGERDDDPVFLLSSTQWEQLADGTGSGVRFVLVYDFFSDKAIEKKAKAVAERGKLKVYSISPVRLSYADKNFTTAGPNTFVSLIRNASSVVTNSFHAVAFCMIFHREYHFIERPDGLNDRIVDLLKRPFSV